MLVVLVQQVCLPRQLVVQVVERQRRQAMVLRLRDKLDLVAVVVVAPLAARMALVAQQVAVAALSIQVCQSPLGQEPMAMLTSPIRYQLVLGSHLCRSQQVQPQVLARLLQLFPVHRLRAIY
jgi:hypothetical protein